MAETELTAAQASALHGTTDGDTGFRYHCPGDAEYFTEGQRQRHRLLTLAKALGNRFRVYKDGADTFGVRPGKVEHGTSTLDYAGSTGNPLTDDATNYVYLHVDGGVLTLGVSTSDFPDPSATPHLPLATIVMASGSYAYTDISDCRQLCCFRLNSSMTAANENALVGGGNADALHVHGAPGLEAAAVTTAKIADDNVTAAKLSGALREQVPDLNLTGANDGDGTGSMTIQARDAAGGNLARRFRLRTWIADVEFAAPSAQADFSVTTGTQLREITPDADYEAITDAAGQVVMNIDTSTDKTVYVMAEADGRIYSGSVAITGNS